MPKMDAQRLAQALNTHPRDLGVLEEYWGIRPRVSPHFVDSTTSTNAALWQMLEQGAPSGTFIVARSQQAGRGQWGRQWQSPQGGLYLSLALEPDLPLSSTSLLTLASAWGVATSFGNLALPVQVKWPNDLVVGNRKLGGILTETRVEQNRIRTLVIGIGINWINPVPANGVSLQQLFPGVLPFPLNRLEDLAAVVLYGLLQGFTYWQSQGSDGLLAAYGALLVNVGQVVAVNGNLASVLGISPEGKIQVQTHSGNGHQAEEMLELEPGEISLGYNA